MKQFREECSGGFSLYEINSRKMAMIRLRRIKQLEEATLPPYFRLCFMEQRELFEIFKTKRYLRWVSFPLSCLLVFACLGHMFTAVGRKHWEIVIRKYVIFVCACLGIWNDESFEAYELETLVKDFTESNPEEATIQFVPLVIGFRAILLQALGSTTTLMSIFIISQCGSPLFVFSPKMREVIPPLLHLNPRKAAMERELTEQETQSLLHIDEWVINIRAISIFLTESRLLVFIYNSISLIIALCLLVGIDISFTTLAMLLLALFPYLFGTSLIPIMYIGKRLKLTDSDFKRLRLSWLVSPRGCVEESDLKIVGENYAGDECSISSLWVDSWMNDMKTPSQISRRSTLTDFTEDNDNEVDMFNIDITPSDSMLEMESSDAASIDAYSVGNLHIELGYLIDELGTNSSRDDFSLFSRSMQWNNSQDESASENEEYSLASNGAAWR